MSQTTADSRSRNAALPSHDHLALMALVREYVAVQKLRTATQLRIGAVERVLGTVPDGIAETFGAFSAAGDVAEADYMKRIVKLMKGTMLGQFVKDAKGLGPACYIALGLMPNPAGFANPAKVWKWFGLDVRNGNAPKSERGKKLGFNPFNRAVAIYRMAEPIRKRTPGTGCVYREMYDARKAHTRTTHPEMTEDCPTCMTAMNASKKHRAEKNQTRERTTVAFDCAHFGGPHWKPSHREADALRFVAKAILLDLWRVANGMTPRGAATNYVLSPICGTSPATEVSE